MPPDAARRGAEAWGGQPHPSVARCYRGWRCPPFPSSHHGDRRKGLASKSPQSFAKRAREIAVREKRERKREKKAEAAAQKAAAAEAPDTTEEVDEDAEETGDEEE